MKYVLHLGSQQACSRENNSELYSLSRSTKVGSYVGRIMTLNKLSATADCGNSGVLGYCRIACILPVYGVCRTFKWYHG